MAATSSEVAKGLVLVALEIVTKEEADEIRNAIEMKFTQERGPTLLGSAQGEHATAYALYVEFVMAIVSRYIAAAQNDNYRGISDFRQEVKSRPQRDQYLLNSFKLPAVALDSFDNLDAKIKQLQVAFSGRVDALLKNIKVINKLKDQLTTQEHLEEMVDGVKSLPKHLEAMVDGINSLDQHALKEEVRIIREEYYFTIARKIAEEYLLFQNKSLHVAFRKAPNYEADKGEGARIAKSLANLRAYNNPGLDSATRASTSSSSSRALRSRAASTAATQGSTSDIVYNISNLLFYPKINEADISELKKGDGTKGILRSNDPNVFGFVVARHLSLIFATFEELGKNPSTKKKIIEEFILLKTREWGFDSKTTNSIKEKIILAIEEAENLAYDSDKMDISVGGGSPFSASSAQDQAVVPHSSGLTPMYEESTKAKDTKASEEEEEEEKEKPLDSSKKKRRSLDS